MQAWALPEMMQNGVDTAVSGQISFTGPHCTWELLLCLWAADTPQPHSFWTPGAYGSWEAKGGQIRASAATPCHNNPGCKSHSGPTYSLIIATTDNYPTEKGQPLNLHPHGHYFTFLTHWAGTGTKEFFFWTFTKNMKRNYLPSAKYT